MDRGFDSAQGLMTSIDDNKRSTVADSAQRNEYQTRLNRICEFWQALPDKPDETPEVVLRSLWLAAVGVPVSCTRAFVFPLPEITPEQCRCLDGLIEQRRQGTPLAHLTGRQHFMGLELLAGPGALIPRKETEILATAAMEGIRRRLATRETCVVVDICTGSGNLALAFAARIVGDVRVYGADISEEAINLARSNAKRLQLDDRVEFRCGDLFAPFDCEEFVGKVDVISCNPPYVSTGQMARMPREISHFEPDVAFNGGPFGVSILFRVISESSRYLQPGGWLFLELGAGQAPAIVRLLKARPEIAQVLTYPDPAGEIRAVAAQWRC